MEHEDPKASVTSISENLMSMAATMMYRAERGDFDEKEVVKAAQRLQDYAADLTLAAGRIPTQ